MTLQESGAGGGFLDASPKWLRLSLVESAGATIASVLVIWFGSLTPEITPVTMILHLLWAISISSWVVSLRVRMPREQKALLGLGVAFAVGSCWSLVQQWLGYSSSGLLNDPLMVVATMVVDGLGGGVTYILSQFNDPRPGIRGEINKSARTQ